MKTHPVSLRLVDGNPDRFKEFLDALIEFRHGNRSGLVTRTDGSVHSPDVGRGDFEGDVWEVSSRYADLSIAMSSRRGRDPWEMVVLKDGRVIDSGLNDRPKKWPAHRSAPVMAGRPNPRREAPKTAPQDDFEIVSF